MNLLWAGGRCIGGRLVDRMMGRERGLDAQCKRATKSMQMADNRGMASSRDAGGILGCWSL